MWVKEEMSLCDDTLGLIILMKLRDEGWHDSYNAEKSILSGVEEDVYSTEGGIGFIWNESWLFPQYYAHGQ